MVNSSIISVSTSVSILVITAGVFSITCYILIYLESRQRKKAIQNQVPQHLKWTPRKEFKASKTTFLVTCAIGLTYVNQLGSDICCLGIFTRTKTVSPTQASISAQQPGR